MIKNIYLQSASALGSTIELRISAENKAIAETCFAQLWQEISSFENRFSRFKKESELSLFNEQAGEKVKISYPFKALLEAVKNYSALSNGLFNPFILPNLQRSGYLHSIDGSNRSTQDYTGRIMSSHESLEIGDDWAKIPANTAIDLGGIGKGYLADQLSTLLEGRVEDYCLSLGGDINVKGKNGEDEWYIDIQSAVDRQKNCATFSSSGGIYGIATSGVMREKGDTAIAHIINPKTGLPIPASNNVCTVVADTVTMADVMASCILIEGTDFAKKLFEQGAIKGVLLQGKEYQVPFMLGNGFSLHNI